MPVAIDRLTKERKKVIIIQLGSSAVSTGMGIFVRKRRK
jgi:hypothetical protein